MRLEPGSLPMSPVTQGAMIKVIGRRSFLLMKLLGLLMAMMRLRKTHIRLRTESWYPGYPILYADGALMLADFHGAWLT